MLGGTRAQSGDELPNPPTLEITEVTHHSCQINWKALGDKNIKYTIQRKKDESIENVYSGFHNETLAADLESTTGYHFRIKIEFDGKEGSKESEWLQIVTKKPPVGVGDLNKAIKRDDAVKLRTILTIEKNVNLDTVDELGFSPLMAAAAYNAQECLDCLLEYDPDLDLQNPSGKTALMLACQSGHEEIAIRLMDEGAGIEGGDGSTPLHWAVDSNSVSIVKRLIEYDCDVNALDANSQWTPIFRLASVTGAPDVAQALIDAGADLSITDDEGKTPLMQATINNNAKLVQVLLENGADPDFQNNLGRSARDMAIAFDKNLVVAQFNAVK